MPSGRLKVIATPSEWTLATHFLPAAGAGLPAYFRQITTAIDSRFIRWAKFAGIARYPTGEPGSEVEARSPLGTMPTHHVIGAIN